MFKVLIYANTSQNLENLSVNLSNFSRINKYHCSISASKNLDSTIEYIKKQREKLDLVFVDFSNKDNALTIISLLNKISPNTTWVFVNAKIQLFLETLVFRPSGYLQSYNDAASINKTVKRIIKLYEITLKSRYFVFKCDGEIIKIPFKEVSYFESCAKKSNCLWKE